MHGASMLHLDPLPLSEGAVSEHGRLQNLLNTLPYCFLKARRPRLEPDISACAEGQAQARLHGQQSVQARAGMSVVCELAVREETLHE